MNLKAIVVFLALGFAACGSPRTEAQIVQAEATEVLHSAPTVGAERWPEVLAKAAGKRVACVVNHTSMSGSVHLVDRLLADSVEVVKVFAPEHGFRGLASDGEKVADGVDPATGVPIVSLYGKQRKPSQALLAGLDLIIFDIQDVGARFYTYISTMHHVMDAAADVGIPVLVLDRPNPNGHYIDGPVLDPAYQSFIGMHPIPIVHGLTVGELAHMINGEGWLSNGTTCTLMVVPVSGYRVGEEYILPIKPSPNLPSQASIYLYPTLCLFEGTVASVGRGTDMPFQVVGHPKTTGGSYSFTPKKRPGARYAKLAGEVCRGYNLQSEGTIAHDSIAWTRVVRLAEVTPVKPFVDRPKHFNACVGSDAFLLALRQNRGAAFRATYQTQLAAYKVRAKPYLLYERTWTW